MADLCLIQVFRNQEHTFRAAELCIEAQEKAIWIETADSLLVSNESKH
jgi:predicted CoA-binding protein